MDLREPDLRAMSYARRMTRVRVSPLVLTLLAGLGGCITPTSPGDPGWTGPNGNPISAECHLDTDCGGGVCARDGTCQPAANVRAIHVTWTLRGKPADTTTCANSPDLQITFSSSARDTLGFAPVPCRQGKFSVDKLPVWYTAVDLGLDQYGGYSSAFDRSGAAAIDLPY
ncbi:MAG: hypothetical protein JWO36_195 [Myxococcales bacterium]|nr:hypothetical protein [Myxococcales bacterium]